MAISVISHGLDAKTMCYTLQFVENTMNMPKILVKDKSTIFITDLLNPGNIYRYDTKHNKMDKMACGLNVPSYMSVAFSQEGPKYIVTESGENRIHVYNHKFKSLHKFELQGEQAGTPRATAVTDMGTVLIVDQRNTRISHYTLDGKFLSHVITKLKPFPIGIAYRHPFMWVCSVSGEYVKCYEIQISEKV